MKKKILSLVLVLLLLPTMFLFSACDKNNSLKSLNKDYLNAFKGHSTIKYENKSVVFDYLNYPLFNEQVINNVGAYKYVKYYNELLANMLDFSNAYVEQISNSNYNIGKNKLNKLNEYVDEFEKDLSKLDTSTKGCADYVQTTQNPTSPLCINKLKTMFNSYNQVFESAFNLNSQLIDMFFSNTTLKDYTKGSFGVLSAMVDVKIDARMKQQVVYTTMVFVEKNIDSESFSKEISENASLNFGNKETNFNTYKTTISNLRKQYTEQNREMVENDVNKSKIFKEKFIKLINIQKILNNDMKFYKSACNKINYIEISADLNSTNNQVVQKELVDNFNYVTNQYNNTLVELLSILGV